MNPIMNEISLPELVRMYPMLRVDAPSCDFAFAHLDYENQISVFQYPCRFNGYLVVICLEGEIAIHLNLQSFVLKKQMVFFCGPGSIIQFTKPEGSTGRTRFYVAALSDNLVQEMARDSLKLYNNSKALYGDPFMWLEDKDFTTLIRYNEVLDRLLDSGVTEMKDALLSLISSVMCFLRSFWRQKHLGQIVDQTVHSPRAQAMVDRFINLVTEHHMTEHYLAFYAAKLGITPKYLSKLVRDVTGRSAPEWIDSFLVLEAKNMLKYSNMAIKEIVYKMHFPDQSSFYKFFKLHTGMIPSDYRKS